MYIKKQEKRALNDFHQSLEVMSKTMNKEEYSLVAGVMFRLLMGSRFGYTEHDPRILQDVQSIWVRNSKKMIKMKKKVVKLKVVRGGKYVK